MAATILTNQSAQSITYTRQAKGSSTVSRNKNEFFFYSNQPEPVTSAGLADNGYWLCKGGVKGAGQVYVWHQNKTGSSYTSSLTIQNPNTYAITVRATNFGLTNLTGVNSDAAAWKSYYNGQSTSITIAAGGWGSLFVRTIANNNVYGTVARLNITNSSGAAASAFLHDLAYKTNSGGAQRWAAAETTAPSRKSGLGDGYYSTINFNRVSVTNSVRPAFQLYYSDSTFSGAELSYITAGTGTSGLLLGGYGQQFNITLPFTNNTGSARKFRIFIGGTNTNAYYLPFAALGSQFTGQTSVYSYPGGTITDIIETDSVANGGNYSVNFSTVVCASTSASYVIGVRPV